MSVEQIHLFLVNCESQRSAETFSSAGSGKTSKSQMSVTASILKHLFSVAPFVSVDRVTFASLCHEVQSNKRFFASGVWTKCPPVKYLLIQVPALVLNSYINRLVTFPTHFLDRRGYFIVLGAWWYRCSF